MDGADRVPVPIRHSNATRAVLSVVFGLHFLAVVWYLLPSEQETYQGLPEGWREPAYAVLSKPMGAFAPVAQPWLNATWSRQHWQLFAPRPSAWNVSGEVVAYYPVDSTALDPARRWRADSIPMLSGESVPFPHFGAGREFRIVFDLGEAGRGIYLRPWYAAGICRRFQDQAGRRPEGVEMSVNWYPIPLPWETATDDGLHREHLGGYNCWELADRPRPWWAQPVTDTLGLPEHLRAAWRRSPT